MHKDHATADKAVTKEECQGEQTVPTPKFTASHSEVADCSEVLQGPSVPVSSCLLDWRPQPATEEGSVVFTAQVTECVGTTTEWS